MPFGTNAEKGTVIIMEKSKKILKIYTIIFALLTVVCVALRFVAVSTVYDADIGYYKTGAVVPTVLHVLCFVSFALAMSIIPLLPKKTLPEALPCGLGVRASAAIQLVFALGMAAYLIYPAFTGGVKVSAVSIICVIAALFSTVYFALVMAGKAVPEKKNSALFGYTVIVYVLMMLANSYFDFYTTMNSPNKLITQIALMSIMVALLFEMRAILGISLARGYAAFTLFAVFLSAVSSIPGVVLFLAGTFTKPMYFAVNFVIFGFFIYLAVRYVSWLCAVIKEKN